jgi:DNA-binding MarR family transcriptional regulator
MEDTLFEDPRLTASGLFVEAFSGFVAQLDQVHARHGLAGSDFDVLIRLARSPGKELRMTDLAMQTAMSTSGMTRVVDRLEVRGLVRRLASPGDRRSSLVALTDAGSECLAADVPDVIDAVQHWLIGPIPPDQLPVFLAALQAVRDTVRPEATTGASPRVQAEAG